MRRKMSPPEARLWNALRNEQVRHLHFRRQVPIGPYFADFSSHTAKLVIEVDGFQHFTEAGQAHDARRTVFLESRGYRVIRFNAGQVLNDLQGVFDAILASARPAHHASHGPPSPQGGGRGD